MELTITLSQALKAYNYYFRHFLMPQFQNNLNVSSLPKAGLGSILDTTISCISYFDTII